jgi:xylulokinase
MTKNYVLAHDLGTTGNKATLYDREGKLIASTFQPYDTFFEHPGWAEQNPNDWWASVCTSTRALLTESAVDPYEIACMSFSGQMQGAVAVDARGMPLHNALIWMDQRAVEQTQSLESRISAEKVYRITGHLLSPAYSLAKMLWLRDHEPEIYASAYKLLCPKDALVARITGEFVTEPSDASGMNLYDLERGGWSDVMLAVSRLDADKLPRLVRSVDVVGEVQPHVEEELGIRAGTPVVIGGGDGACASVGARSIKREVAYLYIGSSAWIANASVEPFYDEHRRTMTFGHVIPHLYIPMGTMQTAGAAYQWARDQLAGEERLHAEQLGVSVYELMNKVAAASPAGANDLLFLPYLMGERSPRWNPDARGVFLGLTMRHTRADMLRAVMEGVALNLCAILDVLLTETGRIQDLYVIGGGATARLWMQILADVFDMPLTRLAMLKEATSMGAAVVGGVGVGLYEDFSVVHHMNPVREVIDPNPANRAIYHALYEVFEATYEALKPLYRQLAVMGKR